MLLSGFLLAYCVFLDGETYYTFDGRGCIEDMADIQAIKQKIRGKAKQVQGEINQQRGGEHGMKGGLQKLVGKLDEVMADAKMKSDQDRQARKRDW